MPRRTQNESFNHRSFAVFQVRDLSLRLLRSENDCNPDLPRRLKYISIECSVALGEALTDTKNYDLARRELEVALTRSERLGLHALLAQSHFLLGRTLELSGHAADALPHYAQARRIADSIQKETRADSVCGAAVTWVQSLLT
jgi:tetratricopeptide (TPR) repeat protein